jgi:ABC-type multidrug transport system fused ATPase/permease subunit
MDTLSAISVFLGALCSFLLLSMRVFPRRWARMFADAGREKDRPKWSWLAIAGSLLGIVVLWFLHFTEGGSYSLAIAVLGSFLLGRTVQALWSKKGLRQSVHVFLQGKVTATFLPYTVVGMVLLLLGLI